MNLSCGARTIKYLMFTFNFLFVITGIVLIAVGASIRAVYSDYHLFLSGNYFSLPNLLIATGCLIFVISFLGCYGAMKQSWIMLMAFSVLLGMIFIFEFSAGIAGYVLRDKTASYLETTMKENMEFYKNDSDIYAIWDSIQSEFQCCGVADYTDWRLVFNKSNDLPISCCPPKSGTVGQFYCNALPPPTSAPPTNVTGPPTTTPVSNTTVSDTTVSNTTVSNTTVSNTTVSNTTVSNTTVSSTTASSPSSILTGNRRKRAATEEKNSTTASTLPQTTTFPYSIGCEAAFGDFVRAHAVDIGGIGFGLAVLQLVGILFSCHLSRQLKNSYYST